MIFSERFPQNLTAPANAFYLGLGYPLFVGAMTLLGYVTGTELYLNAVNTLFLAVGLLITESALPLIPTFMMYVFQTSLINSPENNIGSDYYHDPMVIGVMAGLILTILSISVYIFIKNGRFSKINLATLPFPLAAAFLSFAFIFCGAFCPRWTAYDTLYGVIMASEYFLIFYFFFIGLRGENTERLIDYTTASGAVTALLLSAETAHLYITSDTLIVGGEIVKEQVLYGWGMWTMAGQFLALTIPLCFLGVMRGKRVWFFFSAATLALISAVMTLSRNGLLVAGAAYFASALACCFVGKRKRIFRIALPIGIAAALLIIVFYREELLSLLSDYIDRGFSDNGRFSLWGHGIKSFLSYPVFGMGFFGIQRGLAEGCAEGFSFYPRMMHNTPIQRLGSMGIFGTLAYAYYRYKTLLPFVKKPSLQKTMLGASLLVTVIASLIDNFLFLPKHLIIYSIILAVSFALSEEGGNKSI